MNIEPRKITPGMAFLYVAVLASVVLAERGLFIRLLFTFPYDFSVGIFYDLLFSLSLAVIIFISARVLFRGSGVLRLWNFLALGVLLGLVNNGLLLLYFHWITKRLPGWDDKTPLLMGLLNGLAMGVIVFFICRALRLRGARPQPLPPGAAD